MQQKTFIIIGGGASGIAAAITAKSNNSNLNVVVIEKQSSILKKILQTGNGRCNLSNEHITQKSFYGDPALSKLVLKNFKTEDCKRFFKDMGLFTTSEEGRIYPYSMNASSVRDVLMEEVKRLNIKIKTDEAVKNIEQKYDAKSCTQKITITTDKGSYIADYALLATGGKVGPGCEGDGYKFVRNLGMKYEPISPALVQITTKEETKELKGVRVRGNITLTIEDNKTEGKAKENNKKEITETGEILFTDYGISGIASMQLSSPLNDALKQSQQTVITIDMAPDFSVEQIKEFLLNKGNKEYEKTLKGLINEKVANYITKTEKSPNNIAQKIKSFTLTPTGTKSFKDAQVTHGGVSKKELNDMLESNITPNLFISGELLNVDGICGGYNLHFAWGSGILVGLEVAKRA